MVNLFSLFRIYFHILFRIFIYLLVKTTVKVNLWMADKLAIRKDEVVAPKQEIKKLKEKKRDCLEKGDNSRKESEEDGARSLLSNLQLENQTILLNIIDLTQEVELLNSRLNRLERIPCSPDSQHVYLSEARSSSLSSPSSESFYS